MEKKRRLSARQGLIMGLAYIVETTPRTLFFISTGMTAYWLGCAAYVTATGKREILAAVLLRAAICAALAVLGVVGHRLAGNDDHAWTYYMFWKKGEAVMTSRPSHEKRERSLSIHVLYRRRMQAAVFCAVFALAACVLALDVTLDPASTPGTRFLVWVPAGCLALVAVMIVRLARGSYRFDLGLSGPPEVRALVREAREWEQNGYRTPEEVAAGVPPRSKPPEPRS